MDWMFLFVSSLFWMNAECGGKLSLKMVSFSNPRGKGANGHYCDGKFFIRGSDCDHRFIICLDVSYGPRNTNVCKYGRIATATTFNTNHITFGSRLGGSANPMVFSFNKWMGSCKVKIDVYDDDDNRDDYVDFLSGHYYKFIPDFNQTTSTATSLRLQHRVILNIEMKVYCDEYYHGSGCDVYCKPSDKYTCNKFSGAKICSDDWTGFDCNVKKDACISTPCQNKATCHNSMGSFLCVCPDGYTGTMCETEIDECLSSPCKNNGTCRDLVNSYQCTCSYGYSGPDCGVMTDLCMTKPCLNNGVCQMDPNDVIFHCVCPNGWTGKLCDIDADECTEDICLNGATCENIPGAYQCHCANGWTGDKCETDINECLSSECRGNSTCQNNNGSFTCLCQEGYTGNLCDIDINECSSSPCLNGGICEDEINGFACVCASGYTGVTCDEEIDECAGTHGEIVIYLHGKVTDRENVMSSVKRVVNKYSDIAVDSIKFDGSEEWLQDHTGASVTNITFSLFINGTKLCGEDVQILKELLEKEESKLAFKLYHGDIVSLHRSRPIVERQRMSKTVWYENNWYLVMIAVVVVVMATGVICFVFVRYKRRTGIFRKSDIYSNNSFMWQPGNETSNTLPSLAFDNDLYQSVIQENQESTGQQESADNGCVVNQQSLFPRAYENDIYQQPIAGEQTKLMTYDPDRFDND